MISQKEQAKRLQEEINKMAVTGATTDTQVKLIKQAKTELVKERQALEATMHEAIAERGYIISAPNTEVVLFENADFQLLYCANIDNPAKTLYLMAYKTGAHNVTGRTPITSQGYVSRIMPKDQMNLLLAMVKSYENQIAGLKTRVNNLERDIAPLLYIDHLIKKHKESIE